MRENMQNSRTNRAAILHILTFLPLSMRATTVATLPSPRLKGDTTRACAKNTFLKIPSSFTFPIPLGLKTKEEPKTNQGTPKEPPNHQKVLFVNIAHLFCFCQWSGKNYRLFSFATVTCLMLGANSLSNPRL